MEKSLEIPEETALDALHTGTKALINLIPIAGGTISEIFNQMISPPIEMRRKEWMLNVVNALQKLEERNNGIVQELSNNPEFISILISASLNAFKTHQIEKHEKLRNALINSIQEHFIFDIKQVYVNFIDELTLSHLEVLKLVAKHAPLLFESKSYQLIYDTLDNLEHEILSKFEITSFRFILKDLESKGLLFISRELNDIDNQVSKSSYLLIEGPDDILPFIKVTEFGLNFIKFIETES